MYTKRIRLLTFMAALIIILLVTGRVGVQVYGNYQKTNSFAYNISSNPYKRGVPIDQMDLSEFDYYVSIPTILIGHKISNTIELPKKVVYFIQQDGIKVPALELPKGTTILWKPTDQLYYISPGYGCQGYPTCEKGWRYAQPFMISGKETDYAYLPYYFVRTTDLESVAKKAITSTKPMMNTLANKRRSVQDGVFTYTRFIDNIFYEKGVFFSPDLTQPIWQPLDMIMMSLAVVLLLLYLYMQKIVKISNTENSKEL